MESPDFAKALQLLDSGDVVGLPTETVYGLAARIDREAGLRRIFEVKERPFFDPLIVHVDSVEMAKSCAREWPLVAEVLSAAFWPGPLTLILPKSGRISDLITSGLVGVGLRCPDHPLALQLIQMSGAPLAAPSANRFGRTSPTTWEHVESEFQGQVFILKAPAGHVGIESTVLKVDGERLSLLRPGMIGVAQIEKALSEAGVKYAWNEAVSKAEAPGQMKHHYMPAIPLVMTVSPLSDVEVLAEANSRISEIPRQVEGVDLQQKQPSGNFAKIFELKLAADPTLAARQLYAELRRAADSGADLILFRVDPAMQGEHWAAILERLTKATSLKLS